MDVRDLDGRKDSWGIRSDESTCRFEIIKSEIWYS